LSVVRGAIAVTADDTRKPLTKSQLPTGKQTDEQGTVERATAMRRKALGMITTFPSATHIAASLTTDN
jgi:hypothetical protein